MIPGEVICADGPITLNEGRKTLELSVTNLGDRPVQVGSHFHFFEVNRCLSFDRAAAFGYRLDVPSGNSVRFEPGEEKVVRLVELGGEHVVYGLNDLTRAKAVERNQAASLEKAHRRGFDAYVEGVATGFASGWDADIKEAE
jgi:urease beta subunit